MSITPISLQKVGAVLVAALVFVTVVVIAISAITNRNSPEPSLTPLPSATVTGPAPTRATPPTSSLPRSAVESEAVLKTKSQQIIEQYYHVLWNDTTETFTKRFGAFVDIAKMSNTDISIGQNSCWDQARLLYILDEKARVDPNAITINQIGPTPDHVYATIPGEVAQYDRQGNQFDGTDECPSSHSFVATIEWLRQNGIWTLVHFSNPVRAP